MFKFVKKQRQRAHYARITYVRKENDIDNSSIAIDVISCFNELSLLATHHLVYAGVVQPPHGPESDTEKKLFTALNDWPDGSRGRIYNIQREGTHEIPPAVPSLLTDELRIGHRLTGGL